MPQHQEDPARRQEALLHGEDQQAGAGVHLQGLSLPIPRQGTTHTENFPR